MLPIVGTWSDRLGGALREPSQANLCAAMPLGDRRLPGYAAQRRILVGAARRSCVVRDERNGPNDRRTIRANLVGAAANQAAGSGVAQ